VNELSICPWPFSIKLANKPPTPAPISGQGVKNPVILAAMAAKITGF
jgi:hypothetical protein